MKRVVLTSSVVAVFEWVTEPRVFNETNWNNASVEAVKAKGSEADPFTIYKVCGCAGAYVVVQIFGMA